MSRVEEAMRRAAERAETATVKAEDFEAPPDDPITDVRELAREPYPIELPEKRPARVAPVPIGTFTAEMTEASRPPALPDVPAAGSLFERIGPSLAARIKESLGA